jgi:hypothetical protein
MVIRETTLCVLTALAVIWVAAPVGAEDPSQPEVGAKETPQPDQKAGAKANEPDLGPGHAVSASPPPIYRPPMLSKPTRTVGGGSRGVGDTAPALYAIVPNHVAQSTSNQPSLFWYLDGVPPGSAKIELTLIDDEAVNPLIETTLKKPNRPGLYRIDLADYGVNLSPGKEYEWSVSIIMNPEDRSQDIMATGWIERVARSEDLSARLASEGEDRSVHVFADEGLWYDALTALGDQMQRNPDDRELREVRSSLLRQVGLDTVATAPVL